MEKPVQLVMGGTANFIAFDASNFVVAMTGVFTGGAYATVTNSDDLGGGKIAKELRHYFINENGDYFFTQDKAIHTQVHDNRYYAETTYTVVESGGQFAGLRGSFRSWGALDYGTGRGGLVFEGTLTSEAI